MKEAGSCEPVSSAAVKEAGSCESGSSASVMNPGSCEAHVTAGLKLLYGSYIKPVSRLPDSAVQL